MEMKMNVRAKEIVERMAFEWTVHPDYPNKRVCTLFDGTECVVTESLGDGTWSWTVRNSGHCSIAFEGKAMADCEERARDVVYRDLVRADVLNLAVARSERPGASPEELSLALKWKRISGELDDIFDSIEIARSSFPDYGRSWGPWIEWDGSSPDGPADMGEQSVNLYRRSPNSDWFLVDEAHHVDWSHDGGPNDVLAYRIQSAG